MADVRLPVSLLKTDPLVPPPDTVDDSDREGRPYPHWVGGSRKRSEQSTDADQKSLETVFFDCHLSPIVRKLAMGTSVSNYL